MFKWVKKIVISFVKGKMSDDIVDPIIDDVVKKYDSGLTDTQEKKHLKNIKKLIRPIVFDLLDKWANK